MQDNLEEEIKLKYLFRLKYIAENKLQCDDEMLKIIKEINDAKMAFSDLENRLTSPPDPGEIGSLKESNRQEKIIEFIKLLVRPTLVPFKKCLKLLFYLKYYKFFLSKNLDIQRSSIIRFTHEIDKNKQFLSKHDLEKKAESICFKLDNKLRKNDDFFSGFIFDFFSGWNAFLFFDFSLIKKDCDFDKILQENTDIEIFKKKLNINTITEKLELLVCLEEEYTFLKYLVDSNNKKEYIFLNSNERYQKKLLEKLELMVSGLEKEISIELEGQEKLFVKKRIGGDNSQPPATTTTSKSRSSLPHISTYIWVPFLLLILFIFAVVFFFLKKKKKSKLFYKKPNINRKNII